MSRLIVVLFALLLLIAGSKAQPLDYFATDLRFEDGGSGGGSFMFDDVAGTYGNVRMTTTAGSIRTAGATYLFVCGQDLIACNWVHDAGFVRLLTSLDADQTGRPALILQFLPPLSGAGFAETAVVLAAEANCGDPACNTGVSPGRILFAPGGVAGSSQTLQQYLFFGS